MAVVSIEDVARLASGLPEVSEGLRHGHRTWFVAGRAFAWERPFSKADIRRFGAETPPSGTIVAVAVADLDEKDATLAASSDAVFTIEHFKGYPAVLVQLDKVSPAELHDLVSDAWAASAPPRLAGELPPDEPGGPARSATAPDR